MMWFVFGLLMYQKESHMSIHVFIPDPGTLFYLERKAILTEQSSVFNHKTGKIDRTEHFRYDGTYSGVIFECTSRDSHALVAKSVMGFKDGSSVRIIVVIRDFEFFVVGPEVREDLGLMQTPLLLSSPE